MRLGFACAWEPRPEPTWSYTPWQLRGALRARTEVVDIGMKFPSSVRLPLKALYARRSRGNWVSMWKHSPPARAYMQRALSAAERVHPSDVVLQIHDLAALRTPFLVLQDLSYDVLLAELDTHGWLTHFPTLTRADVLRLRDRQRLIYQRAAGVLAMSQWFADHLVTASGVPADRVHVVHPGASAAMTTKLHVRETARQRRRLLFVGKDFHSKAGPQVVAALALLRAEVDPDITLTVVGPATWPLPGPPPPGVNFLGRLPIDRVAALYPEHDLFVLPSRFEGFGIALVEALAHGLPCVARDAFAMPEIVRPGDNGALITGDDPATLATAIAGLLADHDLFDRVTAQAEGVRAYYCWDRAADQVVDVAKKLCR